MCCLWGNLTFHLRGRRVGSEDVGVSYFCGTSETISEKELGKIATVMIYGLSIRVPHI